MAETTIKTINMAHPYVIRNSIAAWAFSLIFLNTSFFLSLSIKIIIEKTVYKYYATNSTLPASIAFPIIFPILLSLLILIIAFLEAFAVKRKSPSTKISTSLFLYLASRKIDIDFFPKVKSNFNGSPFPFFSPFPPLFSLPLYPHHHPHSFFPISFTITPSMLFFFVYNRSFFNLAFCLHFYSLQHFCYFSEYSLKDLALWL